MLEADRMGTSADVDTVDWQILFYQLAGGTLVLGYSWIDFLFWSRRARFYGWARLGGMSAGLAGGQLSGDTSNPDLWMELSPDRSFSMNELHGTAGRAELDFGLGGQIDGTLKAWASSWDWLFSDFKFTIRSDGSTRAAGHVWIKGTWQLKQTWGFQD
jgi:hypothetical protein